MYALGISEGVCIAQFSMNMILLFQVPLINSGINCKAKCNTDARFIIIIIIITIIIIIIIITIIIIIIIIFVYCR